MFKETAIVVDRAGGWRTRVENPVRHLDLFLEEKEEEITRQKKDEEKKKKE